MTFWTSNVKDTWAHLQKNGALVIGVLGDGQPVSLVGAYMPVSLMWSLHERDGRMAGRCHTRFVCRALGPSSPKRNTRTGASRKEGGWRNSRGLAPAVDGSGPCRALSLVDAPTLRVFPYAARQGPAGRMAENTRSSALARQPDRGGARMPSFRVEPHAAYGQIHAASRLETCYSSSGSTYYSTRT